MAYIDSLNQKLLAAAPKKPGQTPTGLQFGGTSVEDINKGMVNYANSIGANNIPNPETADLAPYQRNLGDTGYAQAKFNRPNTSGPFGSSTVDAQGNINQQFTGAFGQLNDNLTNQAANVAAHPMDWGQFGTMGTGEDAGQQAAQSAYSQSVSRLNPFWNKSEDKMRRSLFQSGMADSSGGDATMNEFGRAKNDAYAGAMTNAMQQGLSAQQGAFSGNLASRQGMVANALRGQTQPFEDMSTMKGFLTQPQVGRDNSMLARDAASNATAPVSVQADKERIETARQGTQFGQFTDQPGEAPGSGAARQRVWEGLSPEVRDRFNRTGWRVQITP